jgi:hypothetical protein
MAGFGGNIDRQCSTLRHLYNPTKFIVYVAGAEIIVPEGQLLHGAGAGEPTRGNYPYFGGPRAG